MLAKDGGKHLMGSISDFWKELRLYHRVINVQGKETIQGGIFLSEE